jgi:two-component system cell cycle sensor histidine kinase/response regulator CckA
MVGGMAPSYARTLEMMGHARIRPGTTDEDPSYLAMIEMQKQWLKVNPAAHDIYTMRKLPDGRNVFVVDSETDYDRDGRYEGDIEVRTAIGEEYDEPDEGLERAFTGVPNFDAVPVTDRWGTWVSAWSPMYDDAGRVEAVLGVDFSAKEWIDGIAGARRAAIAQLAVVLMLLGSSGYVNAMLRADIANRERVEADLRRSQSRLALRSEQSPLAVIEWNRDLKVVDWNAAAERLFGYTREEAIGAQMLDRIAPDAVRDEIASLFERKKSPVVPKPCIGIRATKDGREVTCAWFNGSLVDDDNVIGVTSLCEDITERRKLEAQLQQAQKLEAFAQLAGGIAHDFNNMLSVIQGFTDFVRHRADIPADAIADLDQVAAASGRAGDLTRQLLTFSRRQVFQPRNANLNVVIEQLSGMLRSVLGGDVTFETDLMRNLPEAYCDTAMIEQALVNLAVNARDAMPKGGRFVLSTKTRFVDAAEATRHRGVQVGPFVCLEAADSGCGIARENLPRIFDPFFTTKAVGRGTGLGLATLYGIVVQHRGWVDVESEPGQGSIFRLYLPAIPGAETATEQDAAPELPATGDETILLVDDQLDVRDFIARVLANNGYEVLTAASGIEAIEVWRANRDRIQMLLTDMIMPGGLSGADLARQLRGDVPGLKVIYTSGYSMDFISRKVALQPGINFLQKPYTPGQLTRAIRESFDS